LDVSIKSVHVEFLLLLLPPLIVDMTSMSSLIPWQLMILESVVAGAVTAAAAVAAVLACLNRLAHVMKPPYSDGDDGCCA